MAVGDAHVFPGYPTPVLNTNFLSKSPTTFLTCSSRGEKRKYAGKKFRLNQFSNSQSPGHESDSLTTEPPGWGHMSVISVLLNNTNNTRRGFFLFAVLLQTYSTMLTKGSNFQVGSFLFAV